MPVRKKLQFLLTTLLLLFALYKFVRQDELFRFNTRGDFAPVYFATKLWQIGASPYDPKAIHQLSVNTLHVENDQVYHTNYALYPPFTFPLVAPFALPPLHVGMILITLLILISYLFAIWRLSYSLSTEYRLLFLAIALNFAPFHAGLHLQNIGVIAASLVLLSIWNRSKVINPLLASISFTLKPQLGFLQLIGALRARRYGTIILSLLLPTLCLGIAVGWLALHGPNWVQDYSQTFAAHFQAGTQNNDTTIVDGKANFGLVNLAPIVYLFTQNFAAAAIIPWVVVLILLGIYGYTYQRGKERSLFFDFSVEMENLSVSLLAVLALLPLYNRTYSMILLLPAFAWLFQHQERWLARFALWFGVFITILPTPQAFFDKLFQQGKLSAEMMDIYFYHEPFWMQLLVGIPNLYLLFLAVYLVYEWSERVKINQTPEVV